MTVPNPRRESESGDRVRHAEAALRRLGFARVAPGTGDASPKAEFWVQESGVPRRRFPVFIEESSSRSSAAPAVRPGAPSRAIVVVNSEKAADDAWQKVRADPAGPFDRELAILVVPNRPGDEATAHWHAGLLDRAELLRLATGVVVGLFRRAETGETGPIDFGEMLQLMKRRFGVDVHRSLGVEDDEDALFLLYQMAQRWSWAPGDGGANLHSLVLKPTGPAARLPWFSA